jgi:tetratricopeptide (TPR) repeat protein
MSTTGTKVRELDADDLAVLEEEREFLLRSLRDLDDEHEAGDVDEHDYLALRDDYTARAARVIRAIEQHRAREAEPEPRSIRWRRLAVVAGIVAFALLAGVLVADAAGRREPGDTATGDIRETSRSRIDDAITTAASEDYETAIAQLDDLLATSPDNVEALTWKGWFQYLSGDSAQGLSTLVAAAETDDTFPATHAFMAIVLNQLGRADYAAAELEKLDALDPPASILGMVESLRAEVSTAP